VTLEPTCLLTTKEAAEWMRCSERVINEWVRRGWLEPFTNERVDESERMFTDAELIEADNRARAQRGSARGPRTSVPRERISA
jgi:DNA-binding transcriptional MerR regulator